MSRVQKPVVLFNASVVLAGLKSPIGGSGKLISWVKQKKIKGVISEIILDEIIRNADKIDKGQKDLDKTIKRIFHLQPAPALETVAQFKEIVSYLGDAHVLASSYEGRVNFLVTLDQKYLLVLKKKIKNLEIVTPGELIETLTG